MELKVQELPFGKRTNNFEPDIALLELLGEDGMRRLISDHYNLLVESEIKDMFPSEGPDLEEAKKRSADFFIQRLGGPDYFDKTRGKPMLSRRHAPFKISPKSRIVWLECYALILSKLDLPEKVTLAFWNWLNELSNWMVNTIDSDYGVDIEGRQ
jgi:hemoglobin